ncbi:WASH complex subunit 2C [Caerostris darwini]|uniref:WASH complex subunit 2C n=1 Tax=Caerostris darwini TaxID=1538125 RepID=A0AAV4MRC4_9ARAC|nr:WASH complex subunit 2C [Caerostris darwini]
MEGDPNLIGQDDKKWDRPWTTDDIRKNSANWTLAGDVGLYNLLAEISQNIISRTHEVENAVDSLVYRTKMANAKVCNIINDFHMLSNLQFVENRVYDEEIQETTPDTKPAEKSKEQKESEMLPKIIKAVELGLGVLDQAFTKIHVDEISDSEDEDISSDGRTILEPKDPYENRPLPFIIGSKEFEASDYAGLQDLLEEDVEYSVDVESSVSESDETSTDEEEPLPLDEGQFTGIPSQRKQAQSESDKFSSSDESELFGSEKEENGFISDSSLDNKLKDNKITEKSTEAKMERKESRSSISTIQSKRNLPQVLPVPKMQDKKKVSDDLFATDEPSDDESPFRKKTGLFTSDLKFNDDEKDIFSDDLFGEQPKESKKIESPKSISAVTKTQVKKEKEPVLFGNDEDSDDDIFNTIIRTKSPSIKENKITKQSPSDKADSSSTPSSAPSTKPSGNAFDFMTGAGNSDSLFGDESDADDLFSTKKSTNKLGFDTTEEDDDDLFGLGNKKAGKKSDVTETKKLEEGKKTSLFEESDVVDKPYKKIGTPLPGLVPIKTEEPSKSQSSYKRLGQPLPGLVPKKSDNLFEDSNSSTLKSQPDPAVKKAKDSIFDDSDSSGQEDKAFVAPVKQAVPKTKEISLFDDELDDDDIFSQGPKKLMSPGESPSLVKTEKPQFSKLQNEDKPASSAKIEKKSTGPGLFEDEDDVFSQETKTKRTTSLNKNKGLSLFEESDNFDLFNPKTEVKKENTASPGKNKEMPKNVISNEPPKKADSAIASKPVPQPIKEDIFSDIRVESESSPHSKRAEAKALPLSPDAETSEGSLLGFDAPPDSSKILHVLSKDRARVSMKRRRPTKKGRTAALENSEKEEIPSETTAPPSTSVSSAPDDDLLSGVKSTPSSATQSPATYKQQEKKKMNLMSQLMSEAAATRLSKKSVPVIEEDDDDDIDIFAETHKKDRSKSRGFSFHSPIESVAATESKTEDKKENPKPSGIDLLNSEDADNDDFFAEPSFRNFRSSISSLKEPVLNLDDDDEEEDDLFSTIKTNPHQKAKGDGPENDIFADDSDIFADIQKEKYEMFPSNVYDEDDGDDIFSIVDPLTSNKAVSSTNKPTSTVAATKKEPEKKPVFDDPLSGLLGDD